MGKFNYKGLNITVRKVSDELRMYHFEAVKGSIRNFGSLSANNMGEAENEVRHIIDRGRFKMRRFKTIIKYKGITIYRNIDGSWSVPRGMGTPKTFKTQKEVIEYVKHYSGE